MYRKEETETIMIRAAIFDLDGTLADTMPALQNAMNAALHHFGCPERTREELLLCINYGSREFVRRAFPVDFPAERIDEALACYKSFYAHSWTMTETPFSGIMKMLATLKDRNIRIGCVTNKMEDITQQLMVRLFGEKFFDAVTGQGPFPPKPDPASTLAQLAGFGVLPEEAAFIGDSHIDMRTGKNAGCIPVGVAWGYRPEAVLRAEGAAEIAKTPEELQTILLSL